MTLKLITRAVWVLLFGVGCNSGEFSGAAARKTAEAKPAASEPAKPGKSGTAGKSGKTPKPTDGDDEIGLDDSSSDDLGGGLDPQPGGDQGGDDNSVVDLLGGLLDIATDAQTSQPDENTVVFGGSKSFHIGDGSHANSTCQDQLNSIALSGNKFFFEFEVLEAKQGTINVELETCGVDYSTNSAYISRTGQQIGVTPLAINARQVRLSGRTSGRGKYSVIVESREAGQENPGSPRDHDDFIVRQVKIRVDGVKIKPGRVGAGN